jgi:hypothetical protein
MGIAAEGRREHAGSIMGHGPMSARARRRRVRVMRIVNVPMRRLLRLPFPTPLNRRLMLLYFTGRKTGRAYRQPVSYVPDGDILLSPGCGKWKLNLREDQPIRVCLRGRDVQDRSQFIRDPAEVEGLLKKMAAVNPRHLPRARPRARPTDRQRPAGGGRRLRVLHHPLAPSPGAFRGPGRERGSPAVTCQGETGQPGSPGAAPPRAWR